MVIHRTNENTANYTFKTFSSDSSEAAQATGQSTHAENTTNYHDHKLTIAILEQLSETAWDQDTRHFVLDVAEDLYAGKQVDSHALDKEHILLSTTNQEDFIKKIIANVRGHDISCADSTQLKILVQDKEIVDFKKEIINKVNSNPDHYEKKLVNGTHQLSQQLELDEWDKACYEKILKLVGTISYDTLSEVDSDEGSSHKLRERIEENISPVTKKIKREKLLKILLAAYLKKKESLVSHNDIEHLLGNIKKLLNEFPITCQKILQYVATESQQKSSKTPEEFARNGFADSAPKSSATKKPTQYATSGNSSADSAPGSRAAGKASADKTTINYLDYELTKEILDKLPNADWDRDTRDLVLNVAKDFLYKKYGNELDYDEILFSPSSQDDFIRKIIANARGHKISRADSSQLKILVINEDIAAFKKELIQQIQRSPDRYEALLVNGTYGLAQELAEEKWSAACAEKVLKLVNIMSHGSLLEMKPDNEHKPYTVSSNNLREQIAKHVSPVDGKINRTQFLQLLLAADRGQAASSPSREDVSKLLQITRDLLKGFPQLCQEQLQTTEGEYDPTANINAPEFKALDNNRAFSKMTLTQKAVMVFRCLIAAQEVNPFGKAKPPKLEKETEKTEEPKKPVHDDISFRRLYSENVKEGLDANDDVEEIHIENYADLKGATNGYATRIINSAVGAMAGAAATGHSFGALAGALFAGINSVEARPPVQQDAVGFFPGQEERPVDKVQKEKATAAHSTTSTPLTSIQPLPHKQFIQRFLKDEIKNAAKDSTLTAAEKSNINDDLYKSYFQDYVKACNSTEPDVMAVIQLVRERVDNLAKASDQQIREDKFFVSTLATRILNGEIRLEGSNLTGDISTLYSQLESEVLRRKGILPQPTQNIISVNEGNNTPGLALAREAITVRVNDSLAQYADQNIYPGVDLRIAQSKKDAVIARYEHDYQEIYAQRAQPEIAMRIGRIVTELHLDPQKKAEHWQNPVFVATLMQYLLNDELPLNGFSQTGSVSQTFADLGFYAFPLSSLIENYIKDEVSKKLGSLSQSNISSAELLQTLVPSYMRDYLIARENPHDKNVQKVITLFQHNHADLAHIDVDKLWQEPTFAKAMMDEIFSASTTKIVSGKEKTGALKEIGVKLAGPGPQQKTAATEPTASPNSDRDGSLIILKREERTALPRHWPVKYPVDQYIQLLQHYFNPELGNDPQIGWQNSVFTCDLRQLLLLPLRNQPLIFPEHWSQDLKDAIRLYRMTAPLRTESTPVAAPFNFNEQKQHIEDNTREIKSLLEESDVALERLAYKQWLHENSAALKPNVTSSPQLTRLFDRLSSSRGKDINSWPELSFEKLPQHIKGLHEVLSPLQAEGDRIVSQVQQELGKRLPINDMLHLNKVQVANNLASQHPLADTNSILTALINPLGFGWKWPEGVANNDKLQQDIMTWREADKAEKALSQDSYNTQLLTVLHNRLDYQEVLRSITAQRAQQAGINLPQDTNITLNVKTDSWLRQALAEGFKRTAIGALVATIENEPIIKPSHIELTVTLEDLVTGTWRENLMAKLGFGWSITSPVAHPQLDIQAAKVQDTTRLSAEQRQGLLADGKLSAQQIASLTADIVHQDHTAEALALLQNKEMQKGHVQQKVRMGSLAADRLLDDIQHNRAQAAPSDIGFSASIAALTRLRNGEAVAHSPLGIKSREGILPVQDLICLKLNREQVAILSLRNGQYVVADKTMLETRNEGHFLLENVSPELASILLEHMDARQKADCIIRNGNDMQQKLHTINSNILRSQLSQEQIPSWSTLYTIDRGPGEDRFKTELKEVYKSHPQYNQVIKPIIERLGNSAEDFQKAERLLYAPLHPTDGIEVRLTLSPGKEKTQPLQQTAQENLMWDVATLNRAIDNFSHGKQELRDEQWQTTQEFLFSTAIAIGAGVITAGAGAAAGLSKTAIWLLNVATQAGLAGTEGLVKASNEINEEKREAAYAGIPYEIALSIAGDIGMDKILPAAWKVLKRGVNAGLQLSVLKSLAKTLSDVASPKVLQHAHLWQSASSSERTNRVINAIMETDAAQAKLKSGDNVLAHDVKHKNLRQDIKNNIEQFRKNVNSADHSFLDEFMAGYQKVDGNFEPTLQPVKIGLPEEKALQLKLPNIRCKRNEAADCALPSGSLEKLISTDLSEYNKISREMDFDTGLTRYLPKFLRKSSSSLASVNQLKDLERYDYKVGTTLYRGHYGQPKDVMQNGVMRNPAKVDPDETFDEYLARVILHVGSVGQQGSVLSFSPLKSRAKEFQQRDVIEHSLVSIDISGENSDLFMTPVQILKRYGDYALDHNVLRRDDINALIEKVETNLQDKLKAQSDEIMLNNKLPLDVKHRQIRELRQKLELEKNSEFEQEKIKLCRERVINMIGQLTSSMKEHEVIFMGQFPGYAVGEIPSASVQGLTIRADLNWNETPLVPISNLYTTNLNDPVACTKLFKSMLTASEFKKIKDAFYKTKPSATPELFAEALKMELQKVQYIYQQLENLKYAHFPKLEVPQVPLGLRQQTDEAATWIRSCSNEWQNFPEKDGDISRLLTKYIGMDDKKLYSIEGLNAIAKDLGTDVQPRMILTENEHSYAASYLGQKMLRNFLLNFENGGVTADNALRVLGAILACHPFGDANGRAARFLYAVIQLKSGSFVPLPKVLQNDLSAIAKRDMWKHMDMPKVNKVTLELSNMPATLSSKDNAQLMARYTEYLKTSNAENLQEIVAYNEAGSARINKELRRSTDLGQKNPKLASFMLQFNQLYDYHGIAYRAAYVSEEGASMLEKATGKYIADKGVQSASIELYNLRKWSQDPFIKTSNNNNQVKVNYIFDRSISKKNLAAGFVKDHVAVAPGTMMKVTAVKNQNNELFVYCASGAEKQPQAVFDPYSGRKYSEKEVSGFHKPYKYVAEDDLLSPSCSGVSQTRAARSAGARCFPQIKGINYHVGSNGIGSMQRPTNIPLSVSGSAATGTANSRWGASIDKLVDELKDKDIRTIISLDKKMDAPCPAGTTNAGPTQAATFARKLEGIGIKYIADKDNYFEEDLDFPVAVQVYNTLMLGKIDRLVTLIKNEQQNAPGKVVVVHGGSGNGSAGVIKGAVLVEKYLREELQQYRKDIEKKQPEAKANVLANDNYIYYSDPEASQSSQHTIDVYKVVKRAIEETRQDHPKAIERRSDIKMLNAYAEYMVEKLRS